MNRLRELREDRDLYQKDIAKFIHIDQSNYSKYELEKINIPMKLYINLLIIIILLLIIFYIELIVEKLILKVL